MSTLRPFRRLPSFVALALLLLPAAAIANEDLYQELRAARLDGRRIAVEDLKLERDVFELRLQQGEVHLLEEVQGRTLGAVFRGRGEILLRPANESERRHLAFVADDPKLEVVRDSFEELVLLFADGTELELGKAGEVVTGRPDVEASKLLEDLFTRLQDDYRTNLHLALLAALLNETDVSSGPFLAFFDGAELPPALAGVVPEGIDSVRLLPLQSQEESFLVVSDPKVGGIWYLSDLASEVRADRLASPPRLADALHYSLSTTIQQDASVRGEAIVRFEVLAKRLRLLPVYLDPRLRIGGAEVRAQGETEWRPASFVQEEKEKDADAAVLFAEPLERGTIVELRLDYEGLGILASEGQRNFAVGARQSWYPNLGLFTDRATFDLAFEIPTKTEVVAVGRRVEARDEGERRFEVWKAEQPVLVAGFNYGAFEGVVEKDAETGITIEVYTNPGTTDIIEQINRIVTTEQVDIAGQPVNIAVSQGLLGTVNTTTLARAALADGINTVRIGSAYFGTLGHDRLAITQQPQWSFGQSWPSLVYMPILAFLGSTHRNQLRQMGLLGSYVSDAQVEQLGYHEVAHQWWGHRVGWASYRDVWISEGFAEFTAGLVAEAVQGSEAADRFWEEQRRRIVERPPGSKIASYQAGPIHLGARLANARTPAAYGAIVYAKGSYVLHMLRMLMWDPAEQPVDRSFAEMMHAFVQAHTERQATSRDFQRVVEQHMTTQMNAMGEGSMDWFFEQWIEGTEIPRLKSKLEARRSGGDTYRIEGTIEQLDVSDDFCSIVPIYVDFGKKKGMARLARVRLVGSSSQEVNFEVALPDAPKRVLINARHDVLAMN